MNSRRSVKWWGWSLIILAVALLGVGLWIGFLSAAGGLSGNPGSNLICGSDSPVLLAPITPVPYLTDDGQSLYWLTRGNPGSVMKMPKSSGEIQALAEVQSEPYGILVDEESVFWVEGSWDPGPSFVLKRADKQGGEVAELWPAQETMAQLSLDRDNIYWLDYEAKTVLRMPKKGGEPEALVSGLESLRSFTIANGLFYLGGGDWLGVLEQQGPRTLITRDENVRTPCYN